MSGEGVLVNGVRGVDVRRREWLWVGVVTAVALLIRLIGLGTRSYWFDEAREILRILTPWPDILLVSDGADPPLFRLLLAPIAQVTLNEFWLRLPSVVFSTAAVWLAYVWLRQLGHPRLGLLTAVLLALAPGQILYAQEVSQYSLTVCLALLLLIAFERAAQRGRPRDWLLMTAVSLVAIYAYYGLAWLLLILDADLAWRTWRQRTRTRLMGFMGFHMAMALNLVTLYSLFLAEQFNRFTTNKALTPNLTNIGTLRNLDTQLLNGFVRFFIVPYAPELPNLIVWVFASVLIIGLIVLWQQGLARLVILLAAAVFTLYLAFGLGLYPFGGRYALFLVPFFYAAMAAVWDELGRETKVAPVFVLPLLLVFLAFWPNVAFWPNPWRPMLGEELRPVLAQVQAQLQPDDFIYVYYGAVPAYRVYGRELSNPTKLSKWARQWPDEEKLADVRDAVSEVPRFWLVMSHIAAGEDVLLVGGLEASGYRVVEEYEQQNAAAVLFARE